jgi:hypothetical protein
MEFAGGGGVITFHDERLAKRRKALVRTVPLHDPDGRKGRDGAGYQVAELALQTIDQVTVAMDFDRGADHRDVVNRMLPFVAAQASGRDRVEYARVARDRRGAPATWASRQPCRLRLANPAGKHERSSLCRAHVSRTMCEPHALLSRRYDMKASRILRYPENHERSQR